jgi:Ca-activated chloride channel family protein
MNFLKPTSLYLLLLIPLLLLLYVLRLRRKTYVVSSCLLWEQSIEDMKANSPFQRLRRNLLLPLQVIFLTLAVLALARPFWRGAADVAQNIILIIDGSASMKATDVGKTRFEAAKSAAAKMVDDLSDGNRMMIVEAKSSPRIASSFTSDKSQLRDTLDRMRAADTSTDLGSAIQLASSIAKDIQKSEIFLLSDGAARLPGQYISLPPFIKEELGHTSARMRFVGFGRKDADNVGITAFEIGQSPAEPSERQVFVVLQNFGDTERWPLLLELYHNENLIDVRELSLSPGERRSTIFDGFGYVEGSVKAVIDIDDDFDVDDRAYYILHEPSALRILLVSTGNRFLEEAIRTASTTIKLFREEPETYSAVERTASSLDEKHDVVVFDGFIPDDLPVDSPSGRPYNVIFVNPETDLPFGKLLFHSDNPTVIDWDRSHPVMRFVNLSSLQIDRIRNYEMPPWMKPLVESDMGTLAWLGEHDGRRIIVLSFDTRLRPFNNFPMLTAFPIFVSNALNWLAGPDTKRSHRQVRSGEPLKLPPPSVVGDQIVTVRKPDGEEVKLRSKGGNVVFSDTDTVGIYEVIGEAFTEKFAVNLLDESESDIKAVGKIEIAGQGIASSTISTVSNREIWASLVFVALMLLAAEWWVYHRRVLV